MPRRACHKTRFLYVLICVLALVIGGNLILSMQYKVDSPSLFSTDSSSYPFGDEPPRTSQSKDSSSDGSERSKGLLSSSAECSLTGEGDPKSSTCHFRNVCVAEGLGYKRGELNMFLFGDSVPEEVPESGLAMGADAFRDKRDIARVYSVNDGKEIGKFMKGEWENRTSVLFNRRHRSGIYHFFGQDVATLYALYRKARKYVGEEEMLHVEFMKQSSTYGMNASPSGFGDWARLVLGGKVSYPLSDVDEVDKKDGLCRNVRVVGKKKTAQLCGRWKCYERLTVGGDLPITRQSRNELAEFASQVRRNLEINEPVKSTKMLVGIINRPEGLGRRVRNMEALEKMLARNGIVYKSLFFDDMTMRDQVKAVSEMDVMVTPHGAACTHEVFMKKGSALIELFPWSVTKEHDMYERLAKRLDFDYVSIVQSEANSTLFDRKHVHVSKVTATKKQQEDAFHVMLRGVREKRGRFDQQDWLQTQRIGGRCPNGDEALMLSEVFFRNADIWINAEEVFNAIVGVIQSK